MAQISKTLTDRTLGGTPDILIDKAYRFSRRGGLSTGRDVFRSNLVQKAVSTVPPTIVDPALLPDPSGKNGLPKALSAVSATESPSKQQDRTFSEVSVSFIRDGSDVNFASARVWFIGYQGNTSAVLLADGSTSPITFLCESTGESVTVLVQPVSPFGLTADLAFAAVTTVTLDGVVSSPPAPSIAQSLVGTALGYQFSFNQVVVGSTEDVIASYRVYRNTVSDSASATFIRTFVHDPTSSGAIVVIDSINEAVASYYYYWVSAVNTIGLESTKTAAQSSNIIGSIGSVPPTLSSPFRIANTTTTSTFTTSPGCMFTRADGTTTTIGQTSQAVTGLTAGNKSLYFPYWRETDQSLQWLQDSDLTIPNITGLTCVAASSQWIQTTTSASIPASFSFEIWMKGTVAASQALMSYSDVQGTGAPASVEVQAFVTAAAEITFAIWNGSAWKTLTTAGASVLDGAWHHIMCAYDPTAASGTISTWVDGASTSDSITFWTLTGTGTISSTAGYWHIGFAGGFAGAPLTANTFNSLSLSHVVVYNTAKTINEAGAHFQAFVNVSETMFGSEVVYDSATNYWKLTETSGISMADSIGSNTGTSQGTPTLNQTSHVITILGTPAIAWPFATLIALQQIYLRNRTPLSQNGIAATTTSSGSSTSSGGGSSAPVGGGYDPTGGGGCFTPNTRLKYGQRIDKVRPFDLVMTKNGWRPVKDVFIHAFKGKLRYMGNGESVTEGHHILKDDKWIPAMEIFKSEIDYEGQVWNLHIDSEDPDDLNYVLNNGYVAHNVRKSIL